MPRLNISQDVTLTGSLYAASLVQILIADGVTVTLNTGIRLQNIQFLRANGSTAKVAIASTLGTGTVPDATQAVQLVDSRIGPDLVFSAVGHAITARGRSAIDNAVGSPGTLYLYDVAAAGITQGGPALVDRRPGAEKLDICIATGVNQQDAITQSTNNTVPFSETLRSNAPAGVIDLTAHSLTIPKTCRATVVLSIVLKNTQAGGFYQPTLGVSSNGNTRLILIDLMASADAGGGNCFAMYSSAIMETFVAGDVLTAGIYAGGPGNYRGQSQVSTFTFIES